MKKRSPFMTALVIALSVLLVVEGVISGFWYPGFFRGGRSGGSTASDEMILELANEPQEAVDTASSDRPCKISEIRNTYTEEEYASAPVTEMKVTTDSPRAQSGRFSVDFDEWNLNNAEDTFVVRELPEHSDKDTGYTITGYDFSLEVVITVPNLL